MCQFLQTDLHKFSLNFYKLPNVGVYFLIVVALQVLLVYMNIHSNVRGLSYLDWNCEIQRRSTLVSFQREVISKRHFENICMLLAFYVCIYFQSFVSVSVCGCSNWSVKSCNGFDCHVVCFFMRWSVCSSYKKPLFTAQMWQTNYIPMIRMARPRTQGYALGPNLGFSVQSQANLCLGPLRYKHGKLLFLFGS